MSLISKWCDQCNCFVEIRHVHRKSKAKMITCIIFIIILGFVLMYSAKADTFTEASYYTRESCLKEQYGAAWRSHINDHLPTAKGENFNDQGLTCASWDYDFDTMLVVTRTSPGKKVGRSVTVRVNDRGPAKRLYRAGRRIDLAKAAFLQIADEKEGIVNVRISELPAL